MTFIKGSHVTINNRIVKVKAFLKFYKGLKGIDRTSEVLVL